MKNKLSLIMWALIHNNIVSTTLYMAFLVLDFAFSLLLIVCLYRTVGGASREISITIYELLDISDINLLSYLMIIVAGCFLTMTAILMILGFNNFDWEFYSGKRTIFQVFSFLLVVIR